MSDDLRRCVGRSAANGASHGFLILRTTKSEVYKFGFTVPMEKDVLWFDVSVTYVVLLEIDKR